MGVNGPFLHVFCVCAAVAFGSWLASVITKNNSQVDRLWSLMPEVYIGIFAAESGFANARLNLMLALSILWGARLTYNFWRKGGYRRGGEDYRWPILRARMRPWVFQLFNFGFISAYQHFLLLLIAAPAAVAFDRQATPLNAVDLGAAAAFLVFLGGETLADQQQWRFHARKARGEASGFLSEGLFRYSRHPNFFCEMAMWWCIYAFAVAASGAWLHPVIAGPVLLTLLFQGSTRFTESITLQKYPAYADYQRRTSRLVPLPPRS